MRVFLIAISILVLACSTNKNTTEAGTEKVKEVKQITEFLSIERTLCFGECPSYTITVDSEGNAVYEGRKFVEKVGIYDAVLSVEKMDEIKVEAKRIDYYDFQDKYDASVSDVPSCITMVSTEDGKKRVENRFEAPQELRSFEKYLDGILLNLDWKKRD